MSDNTPFSVIVTEGIHDVRAISRILRLRGFQEADTLQQIPEPLKRLVPQKYPFEEDRLSRRVPYPSFFCKEDRWILVSGVGGDGDLVKNLKEILDAFRRKEVTSMLRGAALIADADAKNAPEKRVSLQKQLEKTGEDEKFRYDPSVPDKLSLYDTDKPLGIYLFPDNQGLGTLEQVLLEGARKNYPELLNGAEGYVTYAEGLPCGNELRKNFNREKAIVGAIANVLRPGRAPQASICDDDWITESSLTELPNQKAFSEFIDSVIGWMVD